MNEVRTTLLTIALATVLVGFLWTLGVDLEPNVFNEADPVNYEEPSTDLTLPIRSIIVDDPDPVTVSSEDPDPFSAF